MRFVVESQLMMALAFVQFEQKRNVEKVTNGYKKVTNCNF